MCWLNKCRYKYQSLASNRFRSRLKLEDDQSAVRNGSFSERCRSHASDVTICRNMDDISNDMPEEMLASNDDESVVWMDVGKLGNLFSHEGSCLFLRLGALCKSRPRSHLSQSISVFVDILDFVHVLFHSFFA